MSDNNETKGQSGGVNLDSSNVTARNVVGRDYFQVIVNQAKAEQSKAPTPLEAVSRVVSDQELDREIATDAQYYIAKLGSWPQQSFNGEDVIKPLQATLEKTEARPQYRQANLHIWATLYRMLGGAYLLHSKLGLGEKMNSALPYLRKSLELWPDQQGLPQIVNFLQTAYERGECQIRDYITNVLMVLRGPGDPQIPAFVDALAGGAQTPEVQAKSWLLHQATPNPIWNFLQGLQLMIKKERGIDAEIEISTRVLPENHVEVQAKVGPNLFLWDVDYARKTFESKNQLTEGFMGIVQKAAS